jgi:glutamyl-Q tRNA(Asp) synthetase
MTSEVAFVDRLAGRVVQHLEDDVGDFVLRRADGLFAYQLAVDGRRRISGHFRCRARCRPAGLDAAPDLAAALPGLPDAALCPSAGGRNAAGEKLSKQTLAQAAANDQAAAELVGRSCAFSASRCPARWPRAVGDVWAWAKAHWSFAAIPRCPLSSFPAFPVGLPVLRWP